eukprot:jgi/Galph1/1244/GphlegSOOS_G5941.1
MSDTGSESRWKLFQHIVLKGVQGGAILGLAVAPYIAYNSYSGVQFSLDQGWSSALSLAWKVTEETSRRAANWGLIGGCVSGVIGIAKLSVMEESDVKGRVELLSESEGQRHMDRFAKFGAVFGSVLFGAKKGYDIIQEGSVQPTVTQSADKSLIGTENTALFSTATSFFTAVLYGAALGTAMGVASHLVAKPDQRPRISRMVTNLLY